MPTIEQLQKLLEADPEDTFVLYAIAQHHAKAGDREKAVAWYDRCLEHDPMYLYAYFHKAKTLQAGGDVTEAVSVLRVGLAKCREAGDAHAEAEFMTYLEGFGESVDR